MSPMETRVERLDRGRREDFFRLHSKQQGGGWCFCVAWWVPTWDGWGERSARQNRELREELLEGGEVDGYLLYQQDQPVGWCQCVLRDRLPKLTGAYGLSPDPAMWAVTCFHLAPARRGEGLAHRLLTGVLTDLGRRGVQRVQGFPRVGPKLEAGEVWTGPVGLFQGAGFRLEREHRSHPIYRKDLAEES